MLIRLILLSCFSISALAEPESICNTAHAFATGSATGAIGATVGQYFSANRTAQQLNYPGPSFKNAYKGLFTSVLGTMPIIAVQSAANSAIKNEIQALNQGKPLNEVQKSAASVSAGVVSSAIVSPIGNIWVAQQQPNNNNKTMREVCKNLYCERGFAGFYRGLTPTMIKQAARASGLLAAYPAVSNQYETMLNNNVLATCATGLTVGPTMALLTHPLDTIETRLQGDSSKTQFKNTWSAFKQAVKTKTLWSGWRWQLTGSIANSIAMGATHQWLSNKNKKN